MQRVIYIIFSLAAAALLSYGCGTAKKASGFGGEYYEGKVSVDIATGVVEFTDCSTLQRMRVADGSEFMRRLSQELSNITEDPGPADITFVGRLIRPDKSANRQTEAIQYKIAVDSVIYLTDARQAACRDYIIAGMYESGEPGQDGRKVLRLKPDYTFQLTSYGAGRQDGQTYDGEWRRTAKLELELLYTDSKQKAESFEILPGRESLAGGNNGQPQEFRKVYL